MNYDPANPTVYFDIGSAIAAIAILLAFGALAKPKLIIRWELGLFRLRTAYWCFFFGILCVIYAAILPPILSKIEGISDGLLLSSASSPLLMIADWPLLGITHWPLFWEVTAAVFMAVGAFGLILVGQRPFKLTKFNVNRFYDLCLSWIARGDDLELGALADEIGENSEAIICFAKKDVENIDVSSQKEGRNTPSDKETEQVFHLFSLWSDRRLCNVIVTRAPLTAICLSESINKHGLYNFEQSLIKQLVCEAFRDPGSILHREEGSSGFGNYPLFRESFFCNYDFVSSKFRPLEAAGARHESDRNIKKYGECLVRATKAFFDAENSVKDHVAISAGLEILVESARALVNRINVENQTVRYDDDGHFCALASLSRAFEAFVQVVQDNEKLLPECHFDENGDGSLDDSLYGAIARTVSDYFGCLADIEGHDRVMRTEALQTWRVFYPIAPEKETKSVVEIRKRLEVKLFDQIDRNLKEPVYCYPMITRLLISVLGLWERAGYSEGEKRVGERLRALVKSNFRSAAALDENRAPELLPSGYIWHSGRGLIIKRGPQGKSNGEKIFQYD